MYKKRREFGRLQVSVPVTVQVDHYLKDWSCVESFSELINEPALTQVLKNKAM